MARIACLSAILAAALGGASAAAEAPAAPAARVADLAWMAGTWAGPFWQAGEVVEETWTVPRDGGIQALVRVTGAGRTAMVELISIEEADGTLHLRLNRWDPGFKRRMETPATMRLAELGENTVLFETAGGADAGMQWLRYSRRGDDFLIHVVAPDGEALSLVLRAVR